MLGHKYSDEEHRFLRSFIPGHTYQETVDAYNAKFTDQITVSRVKGYSNNHKILTGTQKFFEKGHVPMNKGIKGVCAKGCEKGWFKKGHVPHNHKEVGSERLSKDGYLEVKVAEPNKWKLKHRIVYEEYYGPIPKGKVITFLDGNKYNLEISNLALIEQKENIRLNLCGLRSDVPEFTETGILIVKTMAAIEKRKKNEKNKNLSD